MRLSFAALLSGCTLLALPASALSVSPTSDAFGLANTLFLNLPGIQVTNAVLSGSFGQAGTYTNQSGTYGLPNSGIVVSSGNVSDYADGPDTTNGFSTDFFTGATAAQENLLQPITGQPSHFDVVQLDISFATTADVSQVSFFGAFGSEEFPDYVGSFVDGFGLYVNGQNVAGVQPTGGGANLPVNIDHPDMDMSITGTELNAVLAPNGNPVLRFDVPVNPGQINEFQIILADANDSALDTTAYLSSFISQGNPGDNGGPPPTGNGTTEFNPLLPSNPPDPLTGEFVIDLPVLDPGETVWIDPPVTTGYVYDAGTAQFATVTAPSLATVPDLDGYLLSVNGTTIVLAPGVTLDFLTEFGLTPSVFTISGIDPLLELDPEDPLAFPIGVSFADALQGGQVGITPVTEDTGGGNPGTPGVSPVPLPASGVLFGFGLAALCAAKRRRRADT